MKSNVVCKYDHIDIVSISNMFCNITVADVIRVIILATFQDPCPMKSYVYGVCKSYSIAVEYIALHYYDSMLKGYRVFCVTHSLSPCSTLRRIYKGSSADKECFPTEHSPPSITSPSPPSSH